MNRPRHWTSPLQTLRRCPLAALATIVALTLAACTSDEADSPAPTDTRTSPTPTDTSTPAPTATSTASPTPTSTHTSSPSPTATPAGVPDLSSLCRLQAGSPGVERVEFAVPEGWQVEDGNCEFLDPALEQLERGTEPDAAISARVAEAGFATVSPTDEIDDQIRHVGARSGYQAVRVRGEATGQGLRPRGEPVQLWLVDLGAGTDAGSNGEAGTLVLSAAASSGSSFELAAEAADRIAATLRVVPPAAEDAPVVVTRAEGGGTPWAVTFDPSDGCFHLHPGGPTDEPADEACGIEAAAGAVDGAILSDGDLQVVAGLAPPRATLVGSDAASAPHGAVTTSLEGASAFAYDAPTSPLDVRAVDAAGRTIATGRVG